VVLDELNLNSTAGAALRPTASSNQAAMGGIVGNNASGSHPFYTA
jgi:hypothetical protein